MKIIVVSKSILYFKNYNFHLLENINILMTLFNFKPKVKSKNNFMIYHLIVIF